MKQLQTKTIKKRSAAKINWAVRAYTEWRSERMKDIDNFDANIYGADIENINGLSKLDFVSALCKFIPEITKVKDGSPYPGATLYQMVIALQHHLTEKV